MKDGDVRVDRCIVKRERGTFAAEVRFGGVTKAKTFPTLEEAQAWRDKKIAKRPKRDYHKPKGRDLVSAMELGYREANRALIAGARRTTEIIQGREWTVVHLPTTSAVIA